MKRLVMVFLCMVMVFSCSKKETESTSTTSEPAHAQTEQKSDEPKQMIPDAPEKSVIFAAIKPYFDELGTVTEKTVSPGERFDFYVFAEYEESNRMTAAEYRLIMPEGLSIMASAESDSATLHSGQPENDYMIAFKCAQGPKVFLVKYSCLAAQDFSGGVIQTAEGNRNKFIGLVTCGHTPEQYTAEKGQAKLTVK